MTDWQPPPTWGAPAPPGPPSPPGVGPGGRFGWYKRWPPWARIVAPIVAFFVIIGIIGSATGSGKKTPAVATAPVTTTTVATTTTTVAPTTTTQATTTTTTAVTPDELFLADVGYNSAKLGTALPALSDSRLIGLGRGACGDFYQGNSIAQVAGDALASEGTTGLRDRQMGTIIRSAVEVYCPKYISQLP